VILFISGLWTKLKELIANKYAKSVIRTALAAISGLLIGIGLDPELVGTFIEAAEPVAVGAIGYLITQVFSLIDKKKNQE